MATEFKGSYPLGDRRITLSEMSGVTGATIDVGLARLDSVTVLSRSGTSDQAGITAWTNGKLVLSNYTGAGTYMIRTIGV